MRKILIPALILLLLPVMVLAANEAVLSDSEIEISGYTLIVVGTVDEVEVTASKATFTLAASSNLTIKSNDRRILANNLGLDVLCGSTYSQISVSGSDLGTSLEVSIGDGVCASTVGGGGGGGGGGSAAVSTSDTTDTTTPTTTTGEVTATASGGGETTLTSSEGTTAAVNMPANAVSDSTDVVIEEAEEETITASRPTPTSRKVVGNYVYDYSATSGGEIIETFDKDVTLTMTYKDDQISGLQESTLKIYYWKESTSQWVALPTTIDTDTNTLTATVNHFTYFAILGLEEGAEAEEEVVETGATTLADGDLVRNSNAEGMAQFDIYIVKIVNSKKFKRLILSPHVFESYAHFDKNGNGSPWDDVIDVNQTTMDQYTTSDLVRADGDTKVYQLVASDDTGSKKWLNMTAEEFANRGYDSDSIYTINVTDRDAYATGADIT